VEYHYSFDQEQEMELKKRLQGLERSSWEKERELLRQLDEVAIAESQAALERTRLANDKLRLEQELRRHETREAELVHERKDKENCLLVAKERLEKEVYPNCCVEYLRSLSLSICLPYFIIWVSNKYMLYCGLSLLCGYLSCRDVYKIEGKYLSNLKRNIFFLFVWNTDVDTATTKRRS
jgi:hypothetical protein